MRLTVFVTMLLLAAGCTQRLTRDVLVDRYQQTAMTEGVLSSVPGPGATAKPPVVVNWWYTGSWNRHHYLVYRELRWDERGEPVGRQQWYRLPETELSVAPRFEKTDDVSRWVPLYEAARGVVPPPADLAARRSGGPAPQGLQNTPLRGPDEAAQPAPLPPGLLPPSQ